MTSKDLMIGDWYAFRGHPYKCTASDIASIAECEEKGVPTDISEIPLTPKILKKNGWKPEFDKRAYMVKYDLAVEGKNCWMMWAIKEHNLDIQRQDEKLDMYNLKVQRACIPCDYVHQLQHALRLCGIEKAIEL